MLTHRLPYAPNRGDRIRAYHLLQVLRRSFDVELVSLVHDAEEASHANEIAAWGVRVSVAEVPRLRTHARAALSLPGPTPLTHCLLSSPALPRLLTRIVADRPPAMTLAYCSGMARYAMMAPLDRIPFVLDMVDVDSEKWRALAGTSSPPKRWIYAREHTTLQRFERSAIRTAAATMVVNERELETLRGLEPDARVEVVPNGVDAAHFANPGLAAETPVVTFVGVMNYAPNEAAAIWMAREVWPRVLSKRPDAQLWIVGASPTAEVQALASGSIRVTGSVPDTRPLLWASAIGIAPLATARGIQNKVLEAISAGLPVVTTPAVEAGLPAEVATAYRVGRSPQEFGDQVLALLALAPAERRAIAATTDLSPLKWEARLAPVEQLCRWAAAQGSAATHRELRQASGA